MVEIVVRLGFGCDFFHTRSAFLKEEIKQAIEDNKYDFYFFLHTVGGRDPLIEVPLTELKNLKQMSDMLAKQVKFCIQKYIMHKTNRMWKLKINPDKLSCRKFVNEMSVLEKLKTLARESKVKVKLG